MLLRQERRRLRSETVTDVFSLLPLHTTSELESAFKPVAERMIGRYGSYGMVRGLEGLLVYSVLFFTVSEFARDFDIGKSGGGAQ